MLTEATRIKLFTNQLQEMSGLFYMHVSPGDLNMQTIQMEYYLIIKKVILRKEISEVAKIKMNEI